MVHVSFRFMLMILMYWEEAYVLKKNTEGLEVASKETGLEVNAEKTKYIVSHVSRLQCRKISQQRGNKFFQKVERFKYLGITQQLKNPFTKKLNGD